MTEDEALELAAGVYARAKIRMAIQQKLRDLGYSAEDAAALASDVDPDAQQVHRVTPI